MIGSDTDPANIFANIINAVRCYTPKFFDFEIMNTDFFRLPFRAPLLAPVPEVANKFLFLGINRDCRVTGGKGVLHLSVDVPKLRITVGVVGPLSRLAI